MSQNEFEFPEICQKIILQPNYETYEFNLWYVYLFNMSVWYSIQIIPQLQLNAKNGSKMAKNEEQMPGICQKIYLTP